MAKTSPTELFVFFIFFACARILENPAPISAIIDHRLTRNSSSGTDADPCQRGPWNYVKEEVGRMEENCDESDMASFANAVTCTTAFLLDQRPYHAASFVYKFHRHNAGKFGFFAEALLHKLDRYPSFIDKCRRKVDRELMLVDYNRGFSLLLEELDELGVFDEKNLHASEEDEHDEDEDIDDDVDDNDGDLSDDDDDDDESHQDIEANFMD